MDTKLLDGMVVFCAVIEKGSFTAAANALHHTTSHVSKEVARLEDRLGTRLMNRTTRKVSLTETGRIYYENASRLIDDAKSVQAQILSAEERPFGHLKVSVPVMFADACLNQWLPDFVAMYPDVSHTIEVSDRRADIVAEGFDVVVRTGQLKDAEFIARKLMSTRQMTVASPSYLASHGCPQKPQELQGHVLIDFAGQGVSNSWEYRSLDGETVTVEVKAKIRCNSADMEIALACSGFGITRIPQLAAQRQIESGELVVILEDFEKPELEFHAIYPSRQHLAPKIRVFVDFLADRCHQQVSG